MKDKIIDNLIHQLKSWKRSNDISSPTNKSDIKEFLSLIDIDYQDKHLLYKNMNNILQIIKAYSNE